MKRALDEGRTNIIDEIDKSIHPSVLKYIVDIFRNREINKKHRTEKKKQFGILKDYDKTILSINNLNIEVKQEKSSEWILKHGSTIWYVTSNTII